MNQRAPGTIEAIEDAPAPESDVIAIGEPGPPTAEAVADNDHIATSVPAASRTRPLLRGTMRAIFVFALSQYVITTIVVILIALAISHHASDTLSDKFGALARTIHRF